MIWHLCSCGAVARNDIDKLLCKVTLLSNLPDHLDPNRLDKLTRALSKSELRRRVRELGTLYQLTAEFAGTRDLQEVLNIVASTVVEVLRAKACSIRLINEDNDELLVKAVANLSSDYLQKGPIHLSQSLIDQEILATGKPVYIANQQKDPRVMYPLEARREGLVSALCAPMTYKNRTEGIIRVYTSKMHVFDSFEVGLLEAIASQAATAIVNARLYLEAVVSASMKRQISLAGEVQRRMIPQSPPQIPGFDIDTAYVPTYELSGDFFDFISLDDGRVGIVLCDVVGKGVRASLLTASLRASLRAHASNNPEVPAVLANVNRDLCIDTETSDFATMFYGVLDPETRMLSYSSAGHLPPLLVRGGTIKELTVGGGVLGIDAKSTWPAEMVQLQKGDALFLYTDGLSEAMNFHDEEFGGERVKDALLEAIELDRDADGIVGHVLWQMRRFAGLQTRFDDLTLMAFKAL